MKSPDISAFAFCYTIGVGAHGQPAIFFQPNHAAIAGSVSGEALFYVAGSAHIYSALCASLRMLFRRIISPPKIRISKEVMQAR